MRWGTKKCWAFLALQLGCREGWAPVATRLGAAPRCYRSNLPSQLVELGHIPVNRPSLCRPRLRPCTPPPRWRCTATSPPWPPRCRTREWRQTAPAVWRHASPNASGPVLCCTAAQHWFHHMVLLSCPSLPPRCSLNACSPPPVFSASCTAFPNIPATPPPRCQRIGHALLLALLHRVRFSLGWYLQPPIRPQCYGLYIFRAPLCSPRPAAAWA